MITEIDCGGGGTGALNRLEEHLHTLLHQEVGIKPHLPIVSILKTNGKRTKKLPAPRLVGDSALQPCLENVEFRLRRRPLEAQKKQVIEMSRIIESILIKDQRVGQGAHLKEPGPIPLMEKGLQHDRTRSLVSTLGFILSCPHRRASRPQKTAWIPAFAGMTGGAKRIFMQR